MLQALVHQVHLWVVVGRQHRAVLNVVPVAPVQELVEIVDSPNVIRVEVSARSGVVGAQQHLDVEREDGVHLRLRVVPDEQMHQAQTSGAAVRVVVLAGDRVVLEASIHHSSCDVAAL